MEKEYDANILHIKIRCACDLFGTSVYAIENGLGWTKGTIKRWRTCKPSWDKVLMVANFLDVSVDYLVDNTQNPKSHKDISEIG